ncbi:sensor histidine kinase [Anaerosacchariphilus polymeriproducens]|uniref:histidine kinase n=1 Tax=Anaerosacchariphilus polymeriproducens TaxID=1812858 RepID=A0A371B039_9FIRM|nr:ATP-binding protein [Anaerosacchariphilus polymeriproducens]RDU25214.1 HAMP domain-containing protein [Anaerosacchariphilus polymeriproducens]
MKKLSLQWRLTLMTAFLISLTCTVLNFLIYFSGSSYIDNFGYYVVDILPSYEEEYIPDEEWESFYNDYFEQISETKQDFSLNSWVITLIITLLSSSVAYFVIGRSLRPLRELSEQIEDVQAQNLSKQLLVKNENDEIGRLAHSFNKVLERLSESFAVQRQFTGNAAHELRTPLAVMQTKLDVYQKLEHSTEEDCLETMDMIGQQTEQLTHLVQVLLEMAELQSVQRSDHISLPDLVEEVLFDLAPLADKKQVSLIQVDGKGSITGSDILIYRAVYNLVENAIKYNHPNGRVTVAVKKRRTGASITVFDTGCGIPVEHQEEVFAPFFRVDKSRSRTMGGAGLGLALVCDIAQLHGGSVRIVESSSEGTIIELLIP